MLKAKNVASPTGNPDVADNGSGYRCGRVRTKKYMNQNNRGAFTAFVPHIVPDQVSNIFHFLEL